MKIVTNISKEMIMQISNKATKKAPAKYQFKIKIDNKEYEAELLCHVIYDEEYRSFMTGELMYAKSSKKTINEIKIYNLDNDNKKQMASQKTFKVDKEDYYIREIDESVLYDITIINAVNTNNF